MMRNDLEESEFWDRKYSGARPAWVDHAPEPELVRILEQLAIPSGRLLEIGCGVGENAVWLATLGHDVTAFDVSPVAVEKTRDYARERGVQVNCFASSVADPLAHLGTFDLIVDAYCYGSVRRRNLTDAYLATLASVTRRGSRLVLLTGNSDEPKFPGPPDVSEAELRTEIGREMQLVELRPFRTLPPKNEFLGWASVWQRL